MFEINVTVNAPELAEALNNLAAALNGAKPEPAASKTGKADKPAPVPPADYMPPADTGSCRTRARSNPGSGSCACTRSGSRNTRPCACACSCGTCPRLQPRSDYDGGRRAD